MVFKLAICELYNPDLHKYMGLNDVEISSHYMVTSTLTPEEFYNNIYEDEIAILKECYLIWLNPSAIVGNNMVNPLIRNYLGIIDSGNYIKLDIVKINYYGVELVATIKTFWLRLIQRKWKRIYQERTHIIERRMRVGSLRQRERTGKWRNDANTLPSYSF